MAKMTLAQILDFPFRRIGRKNDSEAYYAVGTLRIEPISAEDVRYAVDLPEDTFKPPVTLSFIEAIGAGITEYAEENDIAGLRVTLTAIEAHKFDSSDHWFFLAGQSALEDAIKAHGVFACPITIAEAFDLPFRRIIQTSCLGGWAKGMLRLEPILSRTAEYAVALPEGLPPDVDPSFVTAVGAGVQRSAKEIGLVGVRATLTQIQAHPVDSRAGNFEVAVMTAMRQALEAHGIPVSG